MSRLSFVLVSFALGSSVLATQPAVESLAVQQPAMTLAGSNWTTVLDSTSTVTVPTGIAVITWTVTPLGLQYARPFIGGARMANADAPLLGLGGGASTHSWSAPTEAGEITVGLEILQFEAYESGVGGTAGSMSWTLVVYPDEAPVPAVGTWGLGILGLLVLVAGSAMMRRRVTV